MKLNDLYKMSLSEAVEQMNVTEIKPHTNLDTGDIYSVEIKFVPKDAPKEPVSYSALRGGCLGGMDR